jgi:hypothetical protein
MSKYTAPADNTLTTIFEPLGTIAGVTYYHQTLEYVNSSGDAFFADSGPTKAPSGDTLSAVSQAAIDASDGNAASDPYGTLFCVTGTEAQIVAVIGQTAFNSQVSTNNDAVTDTTSATAAQWSSIESSCSAIEAAGFAYSPMTQNSNSVNSTDLSAAGQSPLEFGIFHPDWSPASSDILKTPDTTASDGVSVTDSTKNGTTTTDITEKTNDGDPTDTADTTLTTTAGTADSAELGRDGTNFADETDTYTNATNWQDTDSGTSYLDGGTSYDGTQTDSNGSLTASITGSGATLVASNATITTNGNTGSLLSSIFGNDDAIGVGRADTGIGGQYDTVRETAGAGVDFLGWDVTGDTVGGKSVESDGFASFGYGVGLVTGGTYGTYGGSGGGNGC